MKYIASTVVSCGLALSACANQPAAVPPRVATEVPVADTSPPPPTGAQVLAEQPAEVQTAITQHEPNSKWPVYRTAEYTRYPYDQPPEPIIDCAPLRTTDLQLQPGETITDVALGDSERWMATPAASGDPRNAVPHLAVKPQAPGIATNLTVYTTKHIYHLLLRTRGHAMQEVEFYYPDELLAAMKDADAAAAETKQQTLDPQPGSNDAGKVANVDASQLNFGYVIAGPNVPWKPTRAYDDGARVFIQMPAGMKSSEAPALLISAGSGTQMVNYRVAGNYYVVDRLFSAATLVSGVGRSRPRDDQRDGRSEVAAMANIDSIHEPEEQPQEPLGGGRFNRLLGISFVVVAMAGGIALALGVESSGTSQDAAIEKAIADPNAEARDRGEVADLVAHGSAPHGAPTMITPPPVMPMAQPPVQHTPPQAPSRYAQWAQDKYMKALEAPQMVSAFHGGQALEIANAKGSASNPTVTLHPPASPYTVMAGNVIPAVLVSGINSDLPGPILAQVSENVADSATGRHLLVPQGSRLIGAYRNASSNNQQRIQIAWQRLIFPNTSSMDLPQMPGTDQSGYAGFSDQVDHHYLNTFGTAALLSLISAGQMVGQMAGTGGGGSYGAYGYYPPNQWAMAGETAGSAASSQMGAVGQQMISNGMNRPPTIAIRPGYQFNVMVTQDLVFASPYGK